MKLRNKLFLGIGLLSTILLPAIAIVSCSSPENNENSTNTNPTKSKNEINKSTLGFKQTVEKNAFKINKQWILDNKTKLLDGDTSLFTSEEDILEFSAKPSNNDETILDINFTLKPGKARMENKEPTTENTSFRVVVTSFDVPSRTLETLGELLNNFLSLKVTPIKFIMPEDKFIRVNERPNNGNHTHAATQAWLKYFFPKTNRGISLGDSTGPDCIWVPAGWNESQSNKSSADVWNWLENKELDDWNLCSYINNLLKEYKYFGEQHAIKQIYLYSQLKSELIDNTTNNQISVYRRKYVPVGWGFRVNNNGSENTTINDGIIIPSDGNYIKNSYKSNEVNFEFGYKQESGGVHGTEETINFTPNYYQEFRQGDYVFSNKGEILSYTGNETNLVIPNSFNVNGKEIIIKKIGNYVFQNKGIESVQLPSKLEIIGTNAFHQNNIKTLNLPKTLKVVEKYAFRKNQLQNLKLPNSLTHIGVGGFEHNPSIGDLVIPNSIERIEPWGFGNSGLTSLTFEKNSKLTSFEDYAFSDCTNLSGTLKIPNSITHISSKAFKNNKFNRLIFEENSQITQLVDSVFRYWSSLTGEIIIPNSVTYIGSWAFQAANVQSLKFQENSQLTKIDVAAFQNSGITSEVIIPKSVEVIEKVAFHGNNNIPKIVVYRDYNNIDTWKPSHVPVEKVIDIN